MRQSHLKFMEAPPRTPGADRRVPKATLPVLVLLGLAAVAAAAQAENWPQFRGLHAQGHSGETNLPRHWSGTENIAWKTPVPAESWSSPIVWADQVFLTTATDGGQSCRLLALDRKGGAVLWNTEVFQQVPRRKEGRNTYATPTPATEGERVYACFGDGSFAALDFSGAVVWTNRDYPFYGRLGLGTSLLLHDGLLIQSSPALSRGQIFLRTERHLFCIGPKR